MCGLFTDIERGAGKLTQRRFLFAAAVIAALFAFVKVAAAQSLLERLVTPGPLVESHAKAEKECSKCHESFSSHSQPQLCLDCHKEIVKDREAKLGYHGKQPDALNEQCRHCHSDHKGRDADIMQLDRERFDHDLTNFRLTDSHKFVACSACHAARKPYHNTATACFDCHKRNDPHKGKLGEKCDSCHLTTKWRETKTFDHGKTRFALEGAHKEVACATCHTGQIYKDLPRNCVSCHKLQDIHGARYGEKCEACHNQAKWKDAKFDHDAKTKFPLHGAHALAKCDVCHTGDLYKDKLAVACVSCHKKQDPHQSALGEKCEKCHNDIDWRKGISFNHNQARFPLVGKHASTPCEECHRTQIYVDTPTACEKCHADTVHQGRLGATPQCGNCHTPGSWSRWRFDHAKQAHWALTGSHAALKCESCHAVRGASLSLPTACESCHKDRYHQGRLGAVAKCGSCHDASRWSHWRFDHGHATGYPLTGAHATLKCGACHSRPNPPNLKLPTQCVECHRRDDPHLSSFGPTCERCHTTSNWRQVTIRN
jgi:hypothetical protein